MNYILQTDGGSRGNPGKAAAGWVIYANGEIILKDSMYLGIKTNNFAEYTAIVEGLKACLDKKIKKIEVRLDSELAVKQIKGIYKVKNDSIKLFIEEIRALIAKFDYISFEHVYRKDNKDADRMVNICLDAN